MAAPVGHRALARWRSGAGAAAGAEDDMATAGSCGGARDTVALYEVGVVCPKGIVAREVAV